MKKESMNNKGFSLVELIIVIAIMAILIVVLAPQYLRYVERSRNSTDYQNATEVVNALQIYAADPQITTNQFTAGTVDITATSASALSASAQATAFNAALTNAGLDPATIHCVSRTAWTQWQIRMIVAADGNVSFSYASNSTATPDMFAETMGTPSGLAP